MIESIACPTCRRRLPLRAELLGQRVRCPICEVSFIAGTATEMTAPAPAVTQPLATSTHSADPPGAPQPLLWPYASTPPAAQSVTAPPPDPTPPVQEVIVEVEDETDDEAASYRGPFLQREPYDIFETSAGGNEPETSPLPADEHTGAPAPPPSPRRYTQRARGRPAPAPAPDEWSEARTAAFRTGLGMILFGVGSLILPRFGYQFEKINKLGEAAPIAGVAVGLFGLLVAVGCLLPRRARVGLRVSLVVLFAISGLLLAAALTLPRLLTP